MPTKEHLDAIRERVNLGFPENWWFESAIWKVVEDREALLEEVDRLTRALEDARPLLAARQHLAARVQRLEEALCDYSGTQSRKGQLGITLGAYEREARVQSLEEVLRDWAAQTMHPKE